MSLVPNPSYTPLFLTPVQRMFDRMLDESINNFERSIDFIAPYWLNGTGFSECNIGNTVGTTVNDEEKFAIEINVAQFRPEELSVNIRDQQLVVEGHQNERNDRYGCIERHFIRKYLIPDDVNTDTIESHLSDRGVLSVCAWKISIEEPRVRAIPIQAASRENRQAIEPKRLEES